MQNYTKGEWKAHKSPLGDWVIQTDDTLICREVRHFNAPLIAASPRMIEFIQKLADSGNQEAKDFIQTLDL